MRKVLFPIHLKLIGFFLALLAGCLGFYVYYATELFKSDKVAYVFESVSSQNAQAAQSLSFKFENAFAAAEILGLSKTSPEISRGVFERNRFLLAYFDFGRDKENRTLWGRPVEDAEELGVPRRLASLPAEERGAVKINGQKRSFYLFYHKGRATLWDGEYIRRAFSESPLFGGFLLLQNKLAAGSPPEGLVGEIKSRQNIQQAFVYDGGKSGDGKVIAAIEPVFNGLAVAATSADYAKALQASANLRDRSLYFGLFVAGAAILLILLFGRLFTVPIRQLYQASQRFGDREFDHRAEVGSKDELGALADSFNGMASEISHYLEEMEEKSRLQNELKTAQLVQESFFPRDAIDAECLKLKAFYRPASECGGDWWGFLESGDRECLIALDVTGHGTAAALVAAVAHNSLTALDFIARRDREFLSSPAKIMDYLNQSLLSSSSSLYATAFVLSVDKENKSSFYCNASHNPPYLVPAKTDLSKDDFIPLMDNIGPRLGESSAAKYEDVPLSADKGDKIILYTDGVTELENPEGKSFGTRRFVKNLIGLALEDPGHLVDQTVRELFEFAQEQDPKDDITLICAEMK